jgi:hypothetical protein
MQRIARRQRRYAFSPHRPTNDHSMKPSNPNGYNKGFQITMADPQLIFIHIYLATEAARKAYFFYF